jgi:hypothetical protein
MCHIWSSATSFFLAFQPKYSTSPQLGLASSSVTAEEELLLLNILTTLQ